MADLAPKQIAADIPLDRAWQVGRRIYVRASYESRLNKALMAINATWDGDQRARYVGTTKRAQVLEILAAHSERVQSVEAVKALGLWVLIPYDEADIRDQAKRLGGIWDGNRKQWAMPTSEAHAEMTAAVTARKAQRDAKAAEDRRQADGAARVQRELAAADQVDRVRTSSGREIIDEPLDIRGRLMGRYVRAGAEQAKPKAGSVMRLRSGERVLVLSTSVRFVSQDAIDDGLDGDSTGDEPHWAWWGKAVKVAPTPEEAAVDAAEKAEADDADEIRAVMAAAGKLPDGQLWDEWTPGLTAASTIDTQVSWGSTGKIIVTTDGRVYYQHPGYYDDYRHTEREVTEPELIARIQAVFAGGDRSRMVHDQISYTYVVRTAVA